MDSTNEKSAEDSNNDNNPKQPGELDSGASCSGNQTKEYKGSSKTFKIAELKAISVCINRQSKNFSQMDIKRAIEDPSQITLRRRPEVDFVFGSPNTSSGRNYELIQEYDTMNSPATFNIPLLGAGQIGHDFPIISGPGDHSSVQWKPTWCWDNMTGEGSAPLFDRKEVKPHINLPLEIDLEKSKKKRRKRSKSRERSSSPYRKRHRSPYSTSPERKHRSHRSRRSESPEERRRRRARSRSRSTSSERRHYVSRRSHASDRRNDRSSSSDSSDDNSRSERRKQYYRERRERDAHYYQEMLPPRDMMIGPHGPMMPRMMMNPMIPWGYPPYPRPPLRGMPPYRPSWEATRPTIVYNSRPPKPPAIEASTSENSTNYVPTTTS